jgi:hypothetical protein
LGYNEFVCFSSFFRDVAKEEAVAIDRTTNIYQNTIVIGADLIEIWTFKKMQTNCSTSSTGPPGVLLCKKVARESQEGTNLAPAKGGYLGWPT